MQQEYMGLHRGGLPTPDGDPAGSAQTPVGRPPRCRPPGGILPPPWWTEILTDASEKITFPCGR